MDRHTERLVAKRTIESESNRANACIKAMRDIREMLVRGDDVFQIIQFIDFMVGVEKKDV